MRWEREKNGGRQGSSSYRAVTVLQGWVCASRIIMEPLVSKSTSVEAVTTGHRVSCVWDRWGLFKNNKSLFWSRLSFLWKNIIEWWQKESVLQGTVSVLAKVYWSVAELTSDLSVHAVGQQYSPMGSINYHILLCSLASYNVWFFFSVYFSQRSIFFHCTVTASQQPHCKTINLHHIRLIKHLERLEKKKYSLNIYSSDNCTAILIVFYLSPSLSACSRHSRVKDPELSDKNNQYLVGQGNGWKTCTLNLSFDLQLIHVKKNLFLMWRGSVPIIVL